MKQATRIKMTIQNRTFEIDGRTFLAVKIYGMYKCHLAEFREWWVWEKGQARTSAKCAGRSLKTLEQCKAHPDFLSAFVNTKSVIQKWW